MMDVATYCKWDDVIWMPGQSCHFNQCRFENPQVRDIVRICKPSTLCFPFLLLGGRGQHIVQAEIHCGFGVVVGPSTG